ncbi:MAG: hypothetical protein JW882_13450 [Deltaproteobacteria bacterium]|nr:hypothetical protein [Deltaproteobacteria bacterium]
MIQESYRPATWRNTTPVDKSKNVIGIGFNTRESGIIRLCLDVESARHLIETITKYLGHQKIAEENTPKQKTSSQENSPVSNQFLESLRSPESQTEIIDIIIDAINERTLNLRMLKNKSNGNKRFTARYISPGSY